MLPGRWPLHDLPTMPWQKYSQSGCHSMRFDTVRCCGAVIVGVILELQRFVTVVIPCHEVLWFYSCCKASTYDLEDRVTVLPSVPLTVTQSSVFSQGFEYQCCNARFKHQFPVQYKAGTTASQCRYSIFGAGNNVFPCVSFVFLDLLNLLGTSWHKNGVKSTFP